MFPGHGVFEQRLLGIIGEAFDSPPHFLIELSQEIISQLKAVFAPFPKRRHDDLDNVQAVVQGPVGTYLHATMVCRSRLVAATTRTSDFDCLVSAHPLKRMSL